MKQTERYIRFLEHGRKLSKNTIKNIQSDFNSFGEDKLIDAIRFDVEDYIIEQNELGMSTATVNRKVSSIKGFFEWQIQNELRQGKNPVGSHMLPKIKHESHESITYEELMELYDKAPTTTIKNAIALMGFAGLRIGEVVGVGVKNNVYKDKNDHYAVELKETKGGGDRNVSLALLQKETVEQLKHGFKGQRGALSENGLWRQLKKYFIEMGFNNLKPHGLRATFATVSVENEVRVDVVRDVLGHTTLNGNAITSRYVGVTSVEDQARELLERWQKQ